MIVFMILYLLAATSIGTLILNLLLTRYLLKSKMSVYFPDIDKREAINFVLTPPAQSENTAATEILATEVISVGHSPK
jgi:hypothetical protein